MLLSAEGSKFRRSLLPALSSSAFVPLEMVWGYQFCPSQEPLEGLCPSEGLGQLAWNNLPSWTPGSQMAMNVAWATRHRTDGSA